MQPDGQPPDATASPASGDEELAAWLLTEDDPYVSLSPTLVSPSAPEALAPNPVNGWSAVGAGFQPLPGGTLISAIEGSTQDSPGAVLSAEVGTTVHSIQEGVVELVRDGDQAQLMLRTQDDVLAYGGTAVVAWAVGDGERVPAGAVLGAVTGSRAAEPWQRQVITIRGASGTHGDFVSWLAGLPDPAELGLRASDVGIGVDPFLTDLRLSGHLDGTERTP